MIHIFDTEIAEKYGVLEAVILQHIHYWTLRNEANDVNFFEGSYWTYNSVKAFERIFHYASAKQIRTALKRLQDEGLLLTETFNQKSFDQTKWYTLTKDAKKLFPDLPYRANGDALQGKPIPDINSITLPSNNSIYNPTQNSTKHTQFIKPTVDDVKQYCTERNNTVDANKFIDYYTSNGWRVGKNPMKDWKAAVRTWERSGYNNVPAKEEPKERPEWAKRIKRV